MNIPWIRGRVAAQAHVALPEGTFEEEYARNGFFGRYAHLYRAHAPVGWTSLEGPLRPRAYDVRAVAADGVDWLTSRKPILENADVRLSTSLLLRAMPYVLRNADADELFFVHDGNGRIETDFGPLSYEPGHYVLVPRGTAYRVVPSSPSFFLLIEATSEINYPDKGMLGQHALFDPAVIDVPTPDEPCTQPPDDDGQYELRILREGQVTRVLYPFCPLDVVGWKGTLSVQRLHVRDIRPVSSDRYHLPPSAHTTFVMRNAVVCSFLPRPLENGDPRAMKVPFFHSNIDFDEVLFYHRGNFFSRAGIAPGMLTFHPQGIHHGPHPKAIDRTAGLTATDEVAIMLDTKNPLRVCTDALPVERVDYWKSWR